MLMIQVRRTGGKICGNHKMEEEPVIHEKSFPKLS